MIRTTPEHSAIDQSNWREVETEFKFLDNSILGINTNLNPILEYDFPGMVTQIEKNRTEITRIDSLVEGAGVMALRRDCSRYMWNDVWFTVRNNAGSADVDVFKVDSSDNIRLGCNIYADDWDGTLSNLFLGVGVCGAGNMSGAIGSVFLGYQTGYSITSGDYNVFAGYQSGYSNTTGSNNFVFGYQSLYYGVTSSFNIAIGYKALMGASGQSAHYNIGIGYAAGNDVTTAHSGIFIGAYAGNKVTTALGIVAIGGSALRTGCTTGGYQVAIGSNALRYTTGSNNIGIGNTVGYGVNGSSTFNYLVAIGSSAGYRLTTGHGNMLLGYSSGSSLTSGGNNAFVGYQTGYYNQTGIGNVLIGRRAGFGVSGQSNSYNVILGYHAGYSITTGNSSIFIGQNSGYYETVGSKLYITNQQGSNEATGRAKALLYGVMSATTANQTLLINATLTMGNNLDMNSKNIIFPSVTLEDILDEDDMASDSAVKGATQQSIKKYVDDNAGAGGVTEFLYATLSVDQTTNLSAGDEIEFDTVSASNGTDISLNTTTHQFTLKDGNKYKIKFAIDGIWSAIGYTTLQIYDVTNSVYVGMRGTTRTTTYAAAHRGGGTDCFAVIEPSGDTVYEARIFSVSNFTTAWSAFCYLSIEEY